MSTSQKSHLWNSFSETEEEGEDSDTNDVSHPRHSRDSCTLTNEPPVKERPPFRKYGVNDFRYLKVKETSGKVTLFHGKLY